MRQGRAQVPRPLLRRRQLALPVRLPHRRRAHRAQHRRARRRALGGRRGQLHDQDDDALRADLCGRRLLQDLRGAAARSVGYVCNTSAWCGNNPLSCGVIQRTLERSPGLVYVNGAFTGTSRSAFAAAAAESAAAHARLRPRRRARRRPPRRPGVYYAGRRGLHPAALPRLLRPRRHRRGRRRRAHRGARRLPLRAAHRRHAPPRLQLLCQGRAPAPAAAARPRQYLADGRQLGAPAALAARRPRAVRRAAQDRPRAVGGRHLGRARGHRGAHRLARRDQPGAQGAAEQRARRDPRRGRGRAPAAERDDYEATTR